MADNKKSFLLYCDLIHTVEALPDSDAGELFKHILLYVNDKDPTTDNLLVNVAFQGIKQQLKRDLEKYEKRVAANRVNGAKGGRPSEKKPNKPTGLNGEPKKPDIDTDTVIVKGKGITIKYRKAEFKKLLAPHLENYGKDLVNKFYSYWTEMGPKDKKMRFEKQTSFDVKRRLGTWKSNNEKFDSNGGTKKDSGGRSARTTTSERQEFEG